MFSRNILRTTTQVVVVAAVLLVPSKAWSCCRTMPADARDCCAPARCCVSCSCCQMPDGSCDGLLRAFDLVRLPGLPDSKLSAQTPCAVPDTPSIIPNDRDRHADVRITALDRCVRLSRLTL